MYHPQDTGEPDDPEHGIRRAPTPAARFKSPLSNTDGIDFTFANIQPPAYRVPPGRRIVMPSRPGTAGFAAAGEYRLLSNAGERIELQTPSRDDPAFAYDDGWYKNTDGNGYH
jgi:hypothetical protein